MDFWPEEVHLVHFGPPTVLWPLLKQGPGLNISIENEHLKPRIQEINRRPIPQSGSKKALSFDI